MVVCGSTLMYTGNVPFANIIPHHGRVKLSSLRVGVVPLPGMVGELKYRIHARVFVSRRTLFTYICDNRVL